MAISCSTYTVDPQSFKEQYTTANGSVLQTNTVNNPLNDITPIARKTLTYQGNQMKRIMVLDKNGLQTGLDVSPSLETRVTLKNGKKHIIYFDTMVLQNDTLSGSKSRMLNLKPTKIAFNDIAKIEIQDGGKKYSYQ